MKILIFGAGSIGSVIGGFLSLKEHDVFLIGRNPHIDEIKKRGLEIKGIWGEHSVKGLQCFENLLECEEKNFDAVFISVRSYDTAIACEELNKNSVEAPIFISFQNGLGNVETIEKFFGEDKAAGARVIFGAKMLDPGVVEVTVYADKIAIGSLYRFASKGQRKMIQQIAEALNSAGISAFSTDYVISHLWSKVFYNGALNPLSAIFGVPYGRLLEVEEIREIMRNVIKEAFLVARSEIGDKLMWKSAEEYIELFENSLVPSTSTHISSMVVAIQKGKRTEIDAINGQIVERGVLRGISCPVNSTLVKIIKAMEKHNL